MDATARGEQKQGRFRKSTPCYSVGTGTFHGLCPPSPGASHRQPTVSGIHSWAGRCLPPVQKLQAFQHILLLSLRLQLRCCLQAPVQQLHTGGGVAAWQEGGVGCMRCTRAYRTTQQMAATHHSSVAYQADMQRLRDAACPLSPAASSPSQHCPSASACCPNSHACKPCPFTSISHPQHLFVSIVPRVCNHFAGAAQSLCKPACFTPVSRAASLRQ